MPVGAQLSEGGGVLYMGSPGASLDLKAGNTGRRGGRDTSLEDPLGSSVALFPAARRLTEAAAPKLVFMKGGYVSPGHLRGAREVAKARSSSPSRVHTAVTFCTVLRPLFLFLGFVLKSLGGSVLREFPPK